MGLSQVIFGQKYMQDVLLLKNGDKIKGTIFEQNEESIKIRLYGGSEFTFTTDEIVEIASELFHKPRNYEIHEQGYYNYSTISVLSFIDDAFINPLNLHTVNGFRFKPAFAVGLGIGLNSYDYHDLTAWSAYINLSGDLSNYRKFTGTYAIDIGTGSALSVDENHPNKIGTYYGLSLGFKLRAFNNFDWVCALGFQTQYIPETRYDYDYISSTEQILNFDHRLNRYANLLLKTGFSF